MPRNRAASRDDGFGRSNDAGRQPRVQSVAKAANILFAVAQSNNGLQAKDIREQLKLPRQATYHLLHTLVTLGMLTKSADNRFLLGLRIGALVSAFSRHLAPPERLLPFVREVANETGETAYASGWWEGEITTLAVVRGRSAIQAVEVPHGNTADAHARASGKLLLALADDATVRRYLDSHELNRRTRNTIVDREALLRALARIRNQGYAVDQEEYAEGLCCLAVPVEDGSVPYAICLSAPAARFAKLNRQYLKIMRSVVRNGAGAFTPRRRLSA